MESPPSLAISHPVIRPLRRADWPELLRLNASNQPALASLNETELAHLLKFDGHHWVAVDERSEVAGYILSFPRESHYDDTEIAWLRQQIALPFFYICQVAVAPEHRRRRVGCRFYATVAEAARRHGASILCCDVNIDPPNPESFAFHHRMGFVQIGAGRASNEFGVAYFAKALGAQ